MLGTNVWGASRPELSTGTCLLSVGRDGEVGEEKDVWGELILKGLVEVPKPELGGGRRRGGQGTCGGKHGKGLQRCLGHPRRVIFSCILECLLFFLSFFFFRERERGEGQRETENLFGGRGRGYKVRISF